MAEQQLAELMGEFMEGEYRPNRPAAEQSVVVEIVDQGALLCDAIAVLQANGMDVNRFDEEQWREVLADQFGVTEDQMADYLERVGSWSVVDEAWYADEGMG